MFQIDIFNWTCWFGTGNLSWDGQVMIKYLRLAWFWARSRYAPQNAFVRCSTCPHWIFHSEVREMKASLSGLLSSDTMQYDVGICALDKPKIFNDFTTGFAFKAWTGRDWCRRHPLYDPRIVQGSDLQYRPGEDMLANAGFDRLPSFREAVAMAMKDADGAIISAQGLQQGSFEGRSNATPNGDDTR